MDKIHFIFVFLSWIVHQQQQQREKKRMPLEKKRKRQTNNDTDDDDVRRHRKHFCKALEPIKNHLTRRYRFETFLYDWAAHHDGHNNNNNNPDWQQQQQRRRRRRRRHNNVRQTNYHNVDMQAGHDKYTAIINQFCSIQDWDPTFDQLQMCKTWLNPLLRFVYGPRVFNRSARSIMRRYELDVEPVGGVVLAARQTGKTFAVSAFLACLLMHVSGLEIALWSIQMKQSKKILALTRFYLCLLGADDCIVRLGSTSEELYVKCDASIDDGAAVNSEQYNSVKVYAGDGKSLRGFSGQIIIVDEIYYVNEEALSSVIFPLFSRSDAKIVGLCSKSSSAADTLQNPLNNLLGISGGDDDNGDDNDEAIRLVMGGKMLLYDLKLVCSACRKQFVDSRDNSSDVVYSDADLKSACPHREWYLPSWKTVENLILVAAILQDKTFLQDVLNYNPSVSPYPFAEMPALKLMFDKRMRRSMNNGGGVHDRSGNMILFIDPTNGYGSEIAAVGILFDPLLDDIEKRWSIVLAVSRSVPRNCRGSHVIRQFIHDLALCLRYKPFTKVARIFGAVESNPSSFFPEDVESWMHAAGLSHFELLESQRTDVSKPYPGVLTTLSNKHAGVLTLLDLIENGHINIPYNFVGTLAHSALLARTSMIVPGNQSRLTNAMLNDVMLLPRKDNDLSDTAIRALHDVGLDKLRAQLVHIKRKEFRTTRATVAGRRARQHQECSWDGKDDGPDDLAIALIMAVYYGQLCLRQFRTRPVGMKRAVLRFFGH